MKTILLSLAILFAIGASAQTTIYDIQGQTETSPYVDQIVTTSGVVTAVIPNQDGVITKATIQDGETGWNGLYVYFGNDGPSSPIAVGDNITIEGQIIEYFDWTELQNILSLTVNSSGNTVNPILLTTTEVNDEQYESMLVAVNAVQFESTTPTEYNELNINDGSGVCLFDDLAWRYVEAGFVPELSTDYYITGIVSYSYDYYRLNPRSADDVSLESGVAGKNISGLEIYPNPVTDNVVYISAESNITTVNIYNMVGQNVKRINVENNNLKINVSDLKHGMYILKVETINGNTNTHKITVK